MEGDNDHITLTFWGVRGSTPCANSENMEYGGNTTCLQLRIADSDEVVILDSGTGIRNLGNKLLERSADLTGRIFITHPHWDHMQGFPFFKPIYDSRHHFTIHMPQQGDRGCREILSGHLSKTFFPVTLDMIDANLDYVTQPAQKQDYGQYSVAFMEANHTTDTAVYKIFSKGHEIIFCPDNELNPDEKHKDYSSYNELETFCKGADVLIHDGQYDKESYRDRRGWGHSAWEEVVAFAKSASVKHLFITHHDPDSTDRELARLDEKLKDKFSSEFDSIQLAKEGAQVTL